MYLWLGNIQKETLTLKEAALHLGDIMTLCSKYLGKINSVKVETTLLHVQRKLGTIIHFFAH